MHRQSDQFQSECTNMTDMQQTASNVCQLIIDLEFESDEVLSNFFKRIDNAK